MRLNDLPLHYEGPDYTYILDVEDIRSLGKRLALLRKDRGETKREVGERSGAGALTVDALERGSQSILCATGREAQAYIVAIERLIRYYNVSREAVWLGGPEFVLPRRPRKAQ